MARPWYLLADIGGTNARFGVGDTQSSDLHFLCTEAVSDHPSARSALESFLSRVRASGEWEPLPAEGCLAVACPTDEPVITFTNSDWIIDKQDLALFMKLDRLSVINDFSAIAYATTSLGESNWEQIGPGAEQQQQPIAILGPGTGLGVSGIFRDGGEARVLSGEGGHVDFAPVGPEELEVLRVLLGRYKRVSAERLLSGAGLQNIYWALSELGGTPSVHATPADITTSAVASEDPVAVASLMLFCSVLGGVAGNLALTLGARGGVYIAGGIAPRILGFLKNSPFRERFVAKGRFRDYLDAIPTRVITADNPGLLGALTYLKQRS
ncbi:MAG: glucokinase [Pseudomonadota bacterium]